MEPSSDPAERRPFGHQEPGMRATAKAWERSAAHPAPEAMAS
jgi:hypothetical protein